MKSFQIKIAILFCAAVFLAVLAACQSSSAKLEDTDEIAWIHYEGYDFYGYVRNGAIVEVDCPIGSRGPAGGLVFYDVDADNNDFDNDGLVSRECGYRYLETAPALLHLAGGKSCVDENDPLYPEGADLFIQAYYRQSPEGANLRFNSTETYHPWDCTSDDLGTGLENTLLMVERLGRGGENAYALAAGPEKSSVYAALLCLDLEYTADNGVSYTDWFLPSVMELHAAAWNLTGIEGSLIYADQGLVFSSSSEKSEATFVSGGNTVNGVDCMHDFSTNGVKSASKPRDMLLPVLPVRRIGCRTEDRTAQKSRIPAESGTYRVGDTGPAGGYIVYDKGRKTDGWRYLEVSPSYLVIGDGGNPTLKSLAGKFASTYNPSKFINKAAVVKTGINTRYFVGCYYRREGYGKNLFVSGKHLYSPDCTSKNIGTGAENTQKLVEAMWEGEGRNSFIKASDSELFSAYFPANVCFRLSVTTDGTVYDDWFLPSIGELEKVGDLPDAIKAKLLDANVACWSSSENPLSPTQMYSYNITTKMTAVKDRSKRIYVLAMRRF